MRKGYIIYALRWPEANYVGMSAGLARRLIMHRSEFSRRAHHNAKAQRLYDEHGWPSVEVLGFTTSKYEARQLEGRYTHELGAMNRADAITGPVEVIVYDTDTLANQCRVTRPDGTVELYASKNEMSRVLDIDSRDLTRTMNEGIGAKLNGCKLEIGVKYSGKFSPDKIDGTKGTHVEATHKDGTVLRAVSMRKMARQLGVSDYVVRYKVKDGTTHKGWSFRKVGE